MVTDSKASKYQKRSGICPFYSPRDRLARAKHCDERMWSPNVRRPGIAAGAGSPMLLAGGSMGAVEAFTQNR